MTDLLTHIKAQNAKTKAWVAEDPTNRFAFMIVEDLEFWAERGITTVAQYERDSLLGAYSDAYKEVYGIRPRMGDMSDVSNEDLEAEISFLYATATQEQQEQAELEEYFAELAAEAERVLAMQNAEPLPYEEYEEQYS